MATDQHEDEVDPVQACVAAAFDVELARGSDVMGAMSAICERLGVALSRWVGADGWHALLARALAETTRGQGDPGLSLDGLGRVQSSAAGVARSDCERVLVALAAVLGRFIGTALARRLIVRGLAAGDGTTPGGSSNG